MQLAAHHADPLLHAQQAAAPERTGWQAAAVVTDFQRERGRSRHHPHRAVPGAAVAHDVRHGFLHHPVDRQRGRVVNGGRRLRQVEREVDVGVAAAPAVHQLA
jgi:hypothetical protein